MESSLFVRRGRVNGAGMGKRPKALKAWGASAEPESRIVKELSALKERAKATDKHLGCDDLPEEHKFERLAPSRKRLMDTVKMVAYRAETALATIVRDKLSQPDEPVMFRQSMSGGLQIQRSGGYGDCN